LTVLLLGSALVVAPACKPKTAQVIELRDDVVVPEPSAAELAELGTWVAAAYAGTAGDPPAFLREAPGSAYLALRSGGKLVGEAWGRDGGLGDSLVDGLAQAKQLAGGASADMVEINLAHTFKTVPSPPTADELFRFASGKRVGIRGIELSYGDHYLRVAPTTMLAAGDRFGPVVQRFLKQAGVKHQEFADKGGKARVFESHQLFVRLPSGEAVKALRGNVYVEPAEVTKANTQATTDLMIDWMLTHLHDDGRMTYLWLPERSAEKLNDNNMIRQWMATNALIKVAEQRQDPQLWARIAKNIDYNLEHFYEQDGDYGLIKFQGTVKLGALSLAAMAIVNHPERARWQTQEHGLRRTVASLWHEDGLFDCFYPGRGGSDRNGNVQNFYPGETLLLWAQLYAESRDPELLRRFAKSYHYYKAWHLDPSDPMRRRPSFVPWHSQANFIVWEALLSPPEATPEPIAAATTSAATTGDGSPALTPEGWPLGTVPSEIVELKPEDLVAYTFEMNDWLIDKMEMWEESAYDDEKGQFYSRKTDYGSPHASATGVYLEGLIDAYEMAKRTGDQRRQARYAMSLSRGIRSVMQLQFVDDIDMYYVTDRERTKGGLRTTTVRPEVRVDNVQHVLMGVLKVLDRFEPGEFKTD
jgi:hypothetical protein